MTAAVPTITAPARSGAAAMPLSTAPPLRELWRRAGRHRRTMVFAASMSVVNKACDTMPELLIGAAVDVVVNDGRSLVGRVFGIEDRFVQLSVLAAITVVAWVAESLSQYVAHVTWRQHPREPRVRSSRRHRRRDPLGGPCRRGRRVHRGAPPRLRLDGG